MTDDALLALPYRRENLRVVTDTDVEHFLRTDDGSRQVVELRLHGNTVIAHSRHWRNVLYNIRKDLRAVLDSAGFLSATYLTHEMTPKIVTGALTCLSCWDLLVSGRNRPLSEPHAVVIAQLMMARLHGLDADPNVASHLSTVFASRHWDLEATILDLVKMGVIGADLTRTRLTLRDRVLVLDAKD